LNNTNE